MRLLDNYVGRELLNKFEMHSYGHALEILEHAFPEEWEDIKNCLSLYF